MRGKWPNSIFAVTILFGILVSSPASGSHLHSSSPTSGPPRIHQPKQIQKRVVPKRKGPSSLPTSWTRVKGPSHTSARPAPKIPEQKKQPAKPHAKLGWRFLLNKQPQAALSAYRQALRQNPKSAHAYLGLGISLKNLGQIRLAKKALVKAVDLNPRLPSALVHLGYLYAEGHFGQSDLSTARRLFKEASLLGDPFATIALLDMKSRSKL